MRAFLFIYRRSTEISLVIRQTMEACILTHLMPRSQVFSILLEPFSHNWILLPSLSNLYHFSKASFLCLQIDIYVQVLQADGGNI